MATRTEPNPRPATRRLFRSVWMSRRFVIAAAALALVGCEGDQGPAGPEGPSGGSVDLRVEFVGQPAVLRADGSSTLQLLANLTTLAGNGIEGMNVTFRVLSGGGTVSPAVATTDAAGEAGCTYTVGTQAGTARLVVSVERAGLTLSDTRDLLIDPLAISPALLDADFATPLMGSWSHDGSFVLFQEEDVNSYSLHKVDAQGGSPVHLGSYRGGACKPDGSGRMAVLGPSSGQYVENDSVLIIDYDGQPVGEVFRPAHFTGTMRNLTWCQDGDSLLIASNTNRYFYVTDALGSASRRLTGPVWGGRLSAVPDSPFVVFDGTGESGGGVYSCNLDTGRYERLVSAAGFYEAGPDIKGASVNAQGNLVVYAMNPALPDDNTGQHDLFTVPFVGGSSRELITGPMEELYPVWSPDGARVLFCSNRSGTGYNLYVYTLPEGASR